MKLFLIILEGLVLTFSLFTGFAFPEDSASPFTGTVNIVLANANGIVVLTDSNQSSKYPSGEPFTSPLPGQKLFRIDDRTVCTIAGFGSTPLPNFPEFTNSAAGVLDRYIEELRTKGGAHSFHEKLTSLYFMFEFELAAIGNLQHLNERQVGDYEFELILAGYDLDGTARVGKIVLSASLFPDGMFSPVLKQMTERVVGQEFLHEEAGIGSAAVQNILEHPAQLNDDPAIAVYNASKTAGHTGSLTVAQIESLAKSLSQHSAIANSHFLGFKWWWPIGGPNQVAILKGDSINSIQQPRFEARTLNTTRFGLIIGGTFNASNLPGASLTISRPGLIPLFLKGRFMNGMVHLDGVYYFEYEFIHASFFYQGGILAFDPTNRITDCVLTLGPHVDRTSIAVQHLISGFPWKAVQ